MQISWAAPRPRLTMTFTTLEQLIAIEKSMFNWTKMSRSCCPGSQLQLSLSAFRWALARGASVALAQNIDINYGLRHNNKSPGNWDNYTKTIKLCAVIVAPANNNKTKTWLMSQEPQRMWQKQPLGGASGLLGRHSAATQRIQLDNVAHCVTENSGN